MAAGFDRVPKILAMSETDFLSVPGFKKKMAEKLHSGIREKMDAATLPQFMAATNIFGRGMGAKRFEVLLAEYPAVLTSTESMQEKAKKVEAVKGFGKKNAAVFIEGLDQFIDFLNETGLKDKILAKLNTTTVTIPDHPLNGKVLVFSGFRSKDLEREIKARGGRVGTSVTADTDFLVLKDSDEHTGKIMKAKDLGVTIITKAQLEDKLVLSDA
jgi:DNA ligase (NAD+)